jgi:type II secretory pathway pseudopilin PulG
VTVLSVLAAILVPNFMRARARGSLTACKSNLKNIGTALEMYSTDNSGKYPPALSYVVPNYLKTIPECPSAGSVTYRAYFGSSAPLNTGGYEDYYYIECVGGNHTRVSVTGNYPAYNGIQGLIERDPATDPYR